VIRDGEASLSFVPEPHDAQFRCVHEGSCHQILCRIRVVSRSLPRLLWCTVLSDNGKIGFNERQTR